MTTSMTGPEPAARAARRRRLGPLGAVLDRRVGRLQAEYLRGSPAARADLARLRRGLGKPAGSVPELWELTIAAVPPDLSWDRDEPSRAEHAAHAALTLYALHQQSMSGPAHIPGVGFGQAVGHLGGGAGPSQAAVARRFMAAATAESADELLTHVRGLVSQLRTAKRGMDYAQFADDVMAILTPGRGTSVRLAWGRAFYRTTGQADAASDTPADDLPDN
ncbi:CRISPR system Cascade subunit CasB [Kribbella antiqua]|uniref:CRISPR system Cascade subunit CasB n=1 Tax=Kribbella antiqua TaxID=2512217 RepID=A0A4R2IEI4_9ACTN|nr:type I-E CRISPR-associated protein Cse2/CasB [Kribbella antiqua]TCO41065.1 CRISPR system Cascade subunit CasB [Kribbella antiqua]